MNKLTWYILGAVSVATTAYALSVKPAFQTKSIVIGTSSTPADNVKLHRGATGIQFVPSDDAALEGTDSVAATKSAADSVGTAQIIDDAVNNDKIIDNAVNTDKILNNSVTTAKIVETIDGSNPAVGEIGRVLVDSQLTSTTATNGTSVLNGFSITVGPGRWRIGYFISLRIHGNAALSNGSCLLSIPGQSSLFRDGVVFQNVDWHTTVVTFPVSRSATISVSTNTVITVELASSSADMACSVLSNNSSKPTSYLWAERMF